VIDTRHRKLFAEGHVPGTILIEADRLGEWGGWFIDYEQPVYLIVGEHDRAEAVRVLQKIGVDTIAGCFSAEAVEEAGLNTETFENQKPGGIAAAVARGVYSFVDVRSQSEWDEGHVPQAIHRFLGKLDEEIESLPRDKPVATQCRTGVRSSIAASILQANGIKNVVNIDGGFDAWQAAGLPVESGRRQPVAVHTA
jgi:hydroxyacylglutathione hydrolase